MTADYPNDADGDALRLLASGGNDMTAPMVIEFPVVVPADIPAKQFASVASAKGYKVHLWKREDHPDWEVICAIEMVPTHADVVRIQRELTEWAKPFRGYCDSWGTFGNKASGPPAVGYISRRIPLPAEVRGLPWQTMMTRYEGFPLALRVRPNADTSANRAVLTSLGVVTHQLAEVRDNGLPESEYNKSLEDFDLALQAAMAGQGAGLVVLVETFAGKRTYYAYVDACETFRNRVDSLGQEFQQHKLTIECRADSSWKFYERYRSDFPW